MLRPTIRWTCALLLLLGGAAAFGQGAPPDAAAADADFQAGHWSEAAAAYRQIVAAQPDDGEAWFRLGMSLRQTERYDEAVAAYEKAIELGTANVRVIAGLGIAYALAGRPGDALARLHEAVEKGLPIQTLESHPGLAGLRDDPRFAALLAAAEVKAHPCENDPKYRAFDFWVGDWDVYANGQLVGHNRIEKILHGCLLLENWQDASGVEGKSFNYYDPSVGKWRQNWVAERGTLVWYLGEVVDGAMRFAGENIAADGSKQRTRVVLEPVGDGDVHHRIEQSSDRGATWTVGFDALYVPHGSPPPGP